MKTHLHLLKIMAIAAMFCLFSSNSFGQVTLPHHDPINYTVGESLQTQTGWATLNTGDNILVATGNLSFSGLAASSGNKFSFDGTGIDAAKAFTQQTTGSVYYSFLLNVTNLGSLDATGGYFTGFNEGTGTVYGGSVWLCADGSGGYKIGISPRTIAANTVFSTSKAINTTLFVVVSYQLNSGTTNDVVKMWINPTSGAAEPTATLSATNAGTDLANLNRILFRQDAAARTPFIEMDELRVGTTWESVTPAVLQAALSTITTTTTATEITSIAATCAGEVTADGGATITERGICYSTITNPTTASSKVTATGTTGTFSCNLSGLTASTTYYYKAYATNSAGTAYGTEESFATIAVGTPLLTVSPLTLDFGNIYVDSVSAAQTITVSGTNLLGNITYTKSGIDAALFTIAETSWNAALGGTLTVTLAPTAEQAYNATITISSTGAANQVISLTGNGIARALTVNPSTLDFGNIHATSSATQTITVTGSNLSENITITKSGADTAAFAITKTPWNATSGGTLNVVFTPTVAGVYNATITISGAGVANKIVTLSGIGTIEPDFIWGDSFEYATESLLTANGWVAHSGSGNNVVTVASGSLSYLNYAPSNIGDKATLKTSGEDVNHSFPEKDTGSLYAAFMISLASAQATGDYFAHFLGQTNSTLSGKIFAKSDSSNYVLGLSKSANTPVYANQKLNFGSTYLVVVKYQIIAGTTNDSIFLYINPVVGEAEPIASAVTGDITGADPTKIMGFALRQGSASNAPTLAFDGIRVAKTWNEAVKYQSSTDPSLSVSPLTLSYGDINLGITSISKTITVSGTNLAEHIAYRKSGADSAAFTIVDTGWNAVTGGTLTVTFKPTVARVYNATVTFSSAGVADRVVFLNGTGTTLPPVTDFTADKTRIPIGGTVTFTDLSTRNPIAWDWAFDGGSPGGTNLQNPTITYNTAGTYSITLTATNQYGSNVKTKELYIVVSEQDSNLICNESFENWTEGKPNCWFGSKTTITNSGVVQYSTSAHTGTYTCQLIDTTTTHKRFTTQPRPVENGKYYQISFWVRGRGEIRTGLFDERTTGSGYAIYNPYIVVDSTIWIQHSQVVTATNTSSIGEFIFSVRNTVKTAGHLQIDDVVITETTPAPTITTNPSTFAFGYVVKGEVSAAKTLIISGFALIDNLAYAKSGADTAAFAITKTNWDTATGGTLSVTFKPTKKRVYNAMITISSQGAADKVVTLSGSGIDSSFTIVASSNMGGGISPNETISVDAFANQTFTMEAESGYLIEDILVDGVSVGIVTSYTFKNVTANHTIEAKFKTDGVADNELAQIKIYPNPTSGNTTIQNSKNAELEITILSAVGGVVAKLSSNATQIQLPTNDLTKGVYFIQMVNKATNNVSTKKLIRN